MIPHHSERNPVSRPSRLLILATAVTAVLLVAPAAFASTGPPAGFAGVHAYNTPVCGSMYVPVDLGHGDYFNVYNAQNGSSCVSESGWHDLAWSVTKSPSGSWQYPNISSGIEWGRYTCYDGRSAFPSSPGSQCMRYPVQQSGDGMPVTSVRYWPGTLTSGNVSYDIWFNRSYELPQDVKQDDGAEIMIWLSEPGLGSPRWGRLTEIGHLWWRVQGWVADHNGTTWNYVRYIAVRPLGSVNRLWLNQVFRDAERHDDTGSGPDLNSAWWLTGIDFGAEMNAGGKGFTVSRYSLSGVR